MRAPGEIRTPDPWHRKPMLYPLSYGGERTLSKGITLRSKSMMQTVGSELVTAEELAQAPAERANAVLLAQGTELSIAPQGLTLERPRNREHGDWATNAAMQLAKAAGTNPRALAEQFAASFAAIDGVKSAQVA